VCSERIRKDHEAKAAQDHLSLELFTGGLFKAFKEGQSAELNTAVLALARPSRGGAERPTEANPIPFNKQALLSKVANVFLSDQFQDLFELRNFHAHLPKDENYQFVGVTTRNGNLSTLRLIGTQPQ
jgi:hypothetical protein